MRLVFLAFVIALTVSASFAQRSTGDIQGSVLDPSGTVVPKASIAAKDLATGIVKNTSSGADGSFTLLNLLPGTYEVTVQAPGFQTAAYSGIVVETGRTTDLTVNLKVGALAQTVEVQAQAEILQTTANQVATTIRNDYVADLPLAGRNTLDFARLTPGAANGANTTTVNNLPMASLNISVDGTNINDSRYRSGGQGFSTLSPVRLDAMEEVTVVSTGSGADSAAGGAMNVFLTTKRGTSKYHGSLFEQFENDALNANSFFNNLQGLAKPKLRLNDFGGNFGGPLKIPFVPALKNKLFFFVNYEDAPRPSTTNRSATMLTSEAQSGVFRFVGTNGQQQTANLLTIAGAGNYPRTIDPTVSAAITAINGTLNNGTVLPSASNLYQQSIVWSQDNGQRNYFPTARLDYQATDRLALRTAWNLRHEHQNGNGPAYPGLGLNSGEFKATRYSWSSGADYTVRPNILNSFSYGIQGSVSANNIRNSVYQWKSQGDRIVTYGSGIGNFIPSATPLIRTNPTFSVSDHLDWVRGRHNLKFGGGRVHSRFYESDFYQFSGVLNNTLGMASLDPANSVIAAGNIPGLRTQDEATAKQLYSTLTARISNIQGFRNINEKTREYEKYAPLVYRESYTSWGLFFQDSFRIHPQLTLNYGLRWEFTGVMTNTNNTFMSPAFEDLYSPSAALFQPGVLDPKKVPTITQRSVTYAPDRVNPAPNFGFAWNPKFDGGALGKLLGHGKSVVRGSYAVNFFDEGLNVDYWVNTNAGNWQSVAAAPGTEFTPGGLTLQSPEPTTIVSPPAFRPPFQANIFAFNNYNVGTTAGVFNGAGNLPTLRNPYVQNWTLSVQREVAKDTVLEVRYAGNKVTHKWHLYNTQEVNVFENGFLQEFRNAQNNRKINQAAGLNSFQNLNRAGQTALPIFEAAFGARGGQPALAAGSSWTSSAFLSNLDLGNVATLAQTLSGATRANAGYFCRMVGNNFSPCADLGYNAAGPYPINFFKPNPYYGELSMTDDNSYGSYHALQVELRRRLNHGLTLQGNYTWSHSLGDYGVTETLATDYATLRNRRLDYGPSQFDTRHIFRLYGTYELPFGKGRKFAVNNGLLDRLIGGWTVGGIGQWTSGRVLPRLISGTGGSSQRTINNHADSGILLNGISVDQLQDMIRRISPNPKGQTILGADPSLIGSDGRANPQYLGLPSTAGQYGQFVYLYGPRFVSVDMSLSKEIRVRERWRFQLQGEFLNLFNHPIFNAPTTTLTSTSFGQISGVQVGAREVQLRAYLRF